MTIDVCSASAPTPPPIPFPPDRRQDRSTSRAPRTTILRNNIAAVVGAPDGGPVPGGDDGSHVVIQGPGGTGKTVLLGELSTSYRRAGFAVVTAAHPDPEPGPAGIAVVVDDAHHVSESTVRRVGHLLERPGTRLAVAFRPWPRPPELQQLLGLLGPVRRAVALGPVERATVENWALEQFGEIPPPGLVDAVLRHSGGLPAFVYPLLRAATEARRPSDPQGRTREAGDRADGAPPARMVVPPDLIEAVRTGLAELDEATRVLLHALAAGAPLDTEVLAELLEVPPQQTGMLVAQARATGYLSAGGSTVPLARAALLSLTPPDVTRDVRRRLFRVLLQHGDEPVELARVLATDGVRDLHAAAVLERAGDAALKSDPVLAEELLAAAVASGAPATALAARRAHAAALAGHFDVALQWTDTVLSTPEAPGRSLAASITATVLAQRGLMSRSAALYRLAGPERAGSAALALIGTGFAVEAEALLERQSRSASAMPTLVSSCEELMTHGILRSLGGGADTGDHIASALSTLTRAAALLEPVGRTTLTLDTPAALASLVALHCGELDVAESVLQRAVDADVGGVPGRPRHLLLQGWVAMMRGRMGRVRECLARAVRASEGPLEPRDELFLRALEVGLARRCGDQPALASAWVHAREAVLRYPIDLFGLLPLGELMVAAARLDDTERLAAAVTEAEIILARLGDPQLWGAPLHWNGAQAAILSEDAVTLRSHVAALVVAARTNRHAATLARAGRCWLQVLTGEIDAAAVTNTAEDLAAVGLAWDGSRLVGQAAVRTGDPRTRAVLLSFARTLSENHGVEDTTAEAPAPLDGGRPTIVTAGRLSHREREVARLVIAGQTYREIGGRLFISAKTVEHHVSRMRQRLGASTRSDLLARLRTELAEGA